MGVRNMFILALFGLLHTVTCQTGPSVPAPGGSGMKANVTATVMGLLNDSGYSGKPTDANVQEIVGKLMNGSLPTDADLFRMGIFPKRPTLQVSGPTSDVIPGGQAGLDPSIRLTGIGQQSAAQPGTLLSSGNPLLSLPGVSPAGTQLGTQTATGTGTIDPFATVAGTAGNSLAFVNLGSAVAAAETTSRPLLGDPFSMTAMSSIGATAQNMATLDLNALGPKPFASLDPIGGLGTPGSPTDLLGPMGQGGLGAPLQTGITDTAMQQRNQQRSPMGDPMTMMMMTNPELMEGMMAENPMMAYLMMQQFNRPRPPPQPALSALPSMPMDMGGMGGLGGGVGGGAGGMMSLQSPMGGGSGGMMDLMGSTSGGSLSASGMVPLGGQGLSGLDALGVGTPMGLTQGSLAAGGVSPGLTDINSLLNMGNPGIAGPSAAPMMDPMFASVG